jgi:hypothetical protein
MKIILKFCDIIESGFSEGAHFLLFMLNFVISFCLHCLLLPSIGMFVVCMDPGPEQFQLDSRSGRVCDDRTALARH